jgi:hypothetical protein
MLPAQHQISNVVVTGRPGYRINGPPMLFLIGARVRQVWPAARMTARRLAATPVQTIVVGTNGSPAAIERARTFLIASFPGGSVPATLTEQGRSSISSWRPDSPRHWR